jgi:hypothetical protein
VYRQSAPVSQAAVAADLHKSLDVRADFSAEIALHTIVPRDDLPQADNFVLSQVPDARIRINARLNQYVIARRTSDAIDVGQTDLNALLTWQVDSSYSCHLHLLERAQYCHPGPDGHRAIEIYY